jgi:hypothetical protein
MSKLQAVILPNESYVRSIFQMSEQLTNMGAKLRKWITYGLGT